MNEPQQQTSAFKSRGGPGRLLNALRYSARGLGFAFAHEAAFRQECALAIVLIPLACWLPVTPVERVLLIGVVLLLLVVELLNSTIEAVVDRVSLEHHPLSGRAKDLGSAAVLLMLLCLALVWGTFALPALAKVL